MRRPFFVCDHPLGRSRFIGDNQVAITWPAAAGSPMNRLLPCHSGEALFTRLETHGRVDRLLPTLVQIVARFLRHRRLELAIHGPALGDIRLVLPKADRETGGLVTVRGRSEAGGAMLSVRDNGAGMERAEMDAILSESSGELPMAHGIGLRNVIRRILLSTNGRGTVELEGGPGEGLEVKIFVPRYREGGAA